MVLAQHEGGGGGGGGCVRLCAVMCGHVRRKLHEVMGNHEVGVAAFLHKILQSIYCVSFIRHG